MLQELERHGVRPTSHTDPERVRAYVRELYKYEISSPARPGTPSGVCPQRLCGEGGRSAA
ncbi:MAG: hypothetical protein U0Q11_07470 [Vicinamibacterales bacterium]